MQISSSLKQFGSNEDPVWQARVDLAASFRWFARLDMHEGVANHLSVAVSPDGGQFLMNRAGRHFSKVRASDLLLLDAHGDREAMGPDAPDPTAWHIHARLHALLPQARCVMHLHSKYATALSALADSTLYPIDQNTMRFFGRVALDDAFPGMALNDDEGDRLASRLTDGKSVLMMGNHGVLVTGPTVARAFDELFYFERACETLITCYMTGKPIRIVSDEIAALTERQWAEYQGLAEAHLREVKAILDVEEPDYRT
ncbi:MAG: class II aldolase/adducin family protein [Parvibaculaceae bacterium]|nr:class II aldolase/adducin family protein [Parvibaculaceae bacterium]